MDMSVEQKKGLTLINIIMALNLWENLDDQNLWILVIFFMFQAFNQIMFLELDLDLDAKTIKCIVFILWLIRHNIIKIAQQTCLIFHM